MEKELENSYNEYISKYTQLNIEQKRSEIIEKLKHIIVLFQQISAIKGLNNDLLVNKELLDLNKENVSEDDFLEGIFVYINMLEDIIGKTMENLI